MQCVMRGSEDTVSGIRVHSSLIKKRFCPIKLCFEIKARCIARMNVIDSKCDTGKIISSFPEDLIPFPHCGLFVGGSPYGMSLRSQERVSGFSHI